MRTTTRSESLPVRSSAEVVSVRHLVRKWAVEIGFTLVEQTKIVTAASELARNMVDYGRGGTMTIELLEEDVRRGLRLIFEDHGPGIADVAAAMRDGFTTGFGMGLGLGGARRLSNEFELQTAPGQGTRVAITRWRGAA
ncbi:MAG TPA: anti-sigma regulatory factor [Thermoanaerobaculia bacterium]|nr:anti-sigma regulatory factor [Thermoanaerobaculia bacterium]